MIRTFHKISPGVYKYVDINDTLDIPVTTTSGSKTLRKIRPTEYKTFLKTKCTQDLQRVNKYSYKYHRGFADNRSQTKIKFVFVFVSTSRYPN